MEIVMYTLALLLVLVSCAAIWGLIVLLVLTVMRFNAWAARVERNINQRKRRIY